MSKLSPEQIEDAKRRYDAGEPVKTIAESLGVERDTVLRQIDEKWARRRREQINAARSSRSTVNRKKRTGEIALTNYVAGPSEDEVLAAQKNIPVDTRDFSARLCGDPLPGRSALDKRA